MTRPHLKIAELEPRGEPLAYTVREVADLLHTQRRQLRWNVIWLWIFAMIAVGLIMFAGRNFAHHMPWLNVWLPGLAQVSMAAVGLFGVRAIFGKRRHPK